MLAKLRTFTLLGIDALPVEVEVDAAAGNAKTVLLGSTCPNLHEKNRGPRHATPARNNPVAGSVRS